MIQYFEPGSRSSSLGIDPRRNLQWILHIPSHQTFSGCCTVWTWAARSWAGGSHVVSARWLLLSKLADCCASPSVGLNSATSSAFPQPLVSRPFSLSSASICSPEGLQLVFFFFSKSLSSSSVEPPDIPPVMLHLKSRPSNPPVLSF